MDTPTLYAESVSRQNEDAWRMSFAIQRNLMPIVISVQFTLIFVLFISRRSGLSTEESVYTTIMSHRHYVRQELIALTDIVGSTLSRKRGKRWHSHVTPETLAVSVNG
jgi:hypothetical protein